VVFFGGGRQGGVRIEAYLRPFHLLGSLEYVRERAYLREPNFQRFLRRAPTSCAGAAKPSICGGSAARAPSLAARV